MGRETLGGMHVDLGDGWSDQLASLRSRRTQTVEKGPRAAAYVTGLTQADELWKAAGTVTPLASPILRYYALMQAARAVAAASPLPNADWAPKGSHGLAIHLDRPRSGRRLEFSDVYVGPAGDGMAKTLALALESPMIERKTPLDEIIACLWHQRYLPTSEPLAMLHPRRPLPITIQMSGYAQAWIFGAFRRVEPGLETDDGLLRDFLCGYPGLADALDCETRWANDPESPLSLFFAEGGPMTREADWVARADGLSTDTRSAYGGQVEILTFFLPAVGGCTTPLHPLVNWYLVLYAFSMLARYHGDLWRQRLDLDMDQEAVHLIDLVDGHSADAIRLIDNTIRRFLGAGRVSRR